MERARVVGCGDRDRRIPSSRHVRNTRRAISPRLATRSLRITRSIVEAAASLPRLDVAPLIICALALALAAPAAGGTLFVIDGRGWGHGVGMSQYGAQGYALDGWEISADPWPLLPRHWTCRSCRDAGCASSSSRAARSVLIGSAKPFRVVDARGKKRVLKPGNRRFSVYGVVDSGFPSGSSRVPRRFGSTGARTAVP